MAFKLRNEKRKYNGPSDPPIYRKDLEGGIVAEANNDGSIFVNKNVPVNSKKFKRAIKHEMQHMKDMESGRSAYGDDWVMWEDDIFFRREINGEKVIDGPNGRWPEGHKNHPWEKVAIKAEKE